MNDFTKGNATRQILLFSLPMLIGNLFQQVYSMVDAVVVGNYVSGHALGAVGMAMNLSGFLLAVLIGLTTGASVVISQFYGAGKHQPVTRAVSTSMVFLAGLSVAITVLGVVFAPAFMRLLNASPEIMDDAVVYLRVLMAGMVFTVFFNMYTAYLRALGNSRGPLYILVLCTLLNIGLDLLFVLAFGMGVFGVGLATVLAQAVSAVLCYLYTKRSAPLLNVQKLSFDPALLRAILKFGFPAAIQLSLVTLANLTITRLINSFGAAAMAGITAATRIDQLATLPVSNVSMALSTFVAQNIGAGQEARARKGLRSSLLFMLALTVSLSALLFVLSPRLVAFFLDETDVNTAEIVGVGQSYLNILVIFYFLFAFLFAFNGFFRGAGDAVIAMVFPVCSLALRTVAAHLLVHYAGMGPQALAWSVPIGWGVCSVASMVYYKKRLWVGKSIVGRLPG